MLNVIENHSLARKISIILVIKLLLLFVLWKICFSQPFSKEQRKNGVASFIYTMGKFHDQ